MEVSESGLPKVEGLQVLLHESTEDKGTEQQTEDIADQSQQQVQAPVEGQAPTQMTDEEVLAQFKSTKDLLKSYKEIQGFTTRVSQENKEKAKVIEELNGRLNKLQEEMEIRSYQAPQPMNQPQKTFEELFIENPEAAITMKANQIATVQRITEVAQEEYTKNPNEYRAREDWVKRIAQDPKYQHLGQSPQGVRKLFEMADTARKQTLQRTAQESLKVLFGDDVDIEALKAQFKKKDATPTNPQTNTLNAYMPNTNTSTRTGADISSNMNDLERQKQEAIKNKDPFAVAGALLRQALQK
jgi:hypothetical protein